MRRQILSELIREVLGPREGIHEVLTSDPLSEYITGVLSPLLPGAPRPSEEVDIAESEGDPASEDSPDGQEIYDPGSFSPALDPRARPHAFGISFVLQGKDSPLSIGLCITWARYFRVKETVSGWTRKPSAFVERTFAVPQDSDRALFLDSNGRQCAETGADIRLTVRARTLAPRVHRVTVFVENGLHLSGDVYAPAESHVFQPQIRVSVGPGLLLAPFRDRNQEGAGGVEEFLYRRKPTMAHGHMCAAVWKGLDVQAHLESGTTLGPECWLDGALLDAANRGLFSSPDVRSEFVPVFPVLGPDLLEDDREWKLPSLDAERLSESWQPEELHGVLSPICDTYSEWLTNREQFASQLAHPEREVAQRLVQSGKRAHARIEEGIRMLESDPDARLAFCFANRAMALMARWAGRPSFTWRPFQIAFVLNALRSTLDSSSGDRKTCDLLWVPTGGGKTEAYLGLAAILIAYRRRRALTGQLPDRTGGGVCAITRYTLRLLTIQQFRRVSSLITACEYLRVSGLRDGGPAGWRPKGCPVRGDLIWGSMRFSVGLWVGGEVTPNRLGPSGAFGTIPGAFDILRGAEGPGEPAQLVTCPSCSSILSVPRRGNPGGQSYTVHLGIGLKTGSASLLPGVVGDGSRYSNKDLQISGVEIHVHPSPAFATLSFTIKAKKALTPHVLDRWWEAVSTHLDEKGCTPVLVPARASRPGYIIRGYHSMADNPKPLDFEVYCPNPDCELNKDVLWLEGAPLDSGWLDLVRGHEGTRPLARSHTGELAGTSFAVARVKERDVHLPDGLYLRMVPTPFWNVQHGAALEPTVPYLSTRIPIPVFTVDEQVYHRVPTVVVATVDKFARVPYEPRSASLFGNVDRYHARFGYYRKGAPPLSSGGQDDPPGANPQTPLHTKVPCFDPPGLIIQDELHLIEGPLGSLVGIYEAAIETLSSTGGRGPKYVAATATIHQAEDQVQSTFDREVSIFPPIGTDDTDRFFVRDPKVNPLNEQAPGRLYVGICAPGLGPLTPLVRVWSRLFQSVYDLRANPAVDPFWTLVGYFNSIRELGGARALYRQDIPNRLLGMSAHNRRGLGDDRCLELSSRTESAFLPSVLDSLSTAYSGDPSNPRAPDALLTTSMFGTGVDVQRLSLMFVAGQPKSTSAYVQSTGRVGRRQGALVVTFYRATRPRDLSHYELFCGYHSTLHRYVEPVTVSPFSSGAISRAAGPVMLGILRNLKGSNPFIPKSSATAIIGTKATPEVRGLPDIIANRSQAPPSPRRPARAEVENFARSELERWEKLALACRDLEYVEYFATDHPVVLGDLPHEHAGKTVVFRDAPQSLREVEETTGFQTED